MRIGAIDAECERVRAWRHPPFSLSVPAFAGIVAVLSGCATAPSPSPGPDAAPHVVADDPIEPVNRAIFAVNLRLDRYLIRPVARGYQIVTPTIVQTGVTHLLENLGSPAILLNDLLQGNLRCAGDTASRIAVNSVVGLGGVFDVGTHWGIPRHKADLGQTLGSWGVPPGPYLYAPLIGPLYLRDAGAYVAEAYADPFAIEMHQAHLDEANYARLGMTAIDFRARNMSEIDDLQKSALDFYAAIHSIARQRRTAAVAAARLPATPGRCSLQ